MTESTVKVNYQSDKINSESQKKRSERHPQIETDERRRSYKIIAIFRIVYQIRKPETLI